MRSLFFSYFGLRRRVRYWRRNKFIRPMKTYEGALKVKILVSGLFFCFGWSYFGRMYFSRSATVDEDGTKRVQSIASRVKNREHVNILELMTGIESKPRRPPVELSKTEFPADDFG
ncbi:hypothetical protein GPALN_005211 [Globodera pallida]|uniref:Transmembrane protein n=1 Tax=Globodera pallida TaxID=36090 RepID=A0A183C1T1_GLOPA|nr:hypothetical protein GPALN_005211 [Globodera pallida]